MAFTATNLNASMVIAGDVINDVSRLIVLAAETKAIDGRTRFTLLTEDGLRVHRTYNGDHPLLVEPLGAPRVVQESIILRRGLGLFLETLG